MSTEKLKKTLIGKNNTQRDRIKKQNRGERDKKREKMREREGDRKRNKKGH